MNNSRNKKLLASFLTALGLSAVSVNSKVANAAFESYKSKERENLNTLVDCVKKINSRDSVREAYINLLDNLKTILSHREEGNVNSFLKTSILGQELSVYELENEVTRCKYSDSYDFFSKDSLKTVKNFINKINSLRGGYYTVWNTDVINAIKNLQYCIDNNDKFSDEKIQEIETSIKKISSNNQDNKNNYYTQSVKIGNVVLSPSDQDWIRNNVILLNQVHPLCYHNVSMQFLAGPEFRNSNFGSEKIQTMINWLNKTREEAAKKNMTIHERLKTKVDVPLKIRKFPDGCENWINADEGEQFLFYSGCMNTEYRKFDGIDISESINGIKKGQTGEASKYQYNGVTENVGDKSMNNVVYNSVVENAEGFTINFLEPDKTNIEEILYCFKYRDKGYLPTFIAMNSSWNHYSAFLVVYNNDQEIKYLIYLDGGSDKAEILTLDEAIAKIKKETISQMNIGTFSVRYSSSDIVKEHYTTKNSDIVKEHYTTKN